MRGEGRLRHLGRYRLPVRAWISEWGSARPPSLGLLLALTLVGLGACDSGTGPSAATALVVMESEDGGQVRVVISTDFILAGDRDGSVHLNLIRSDTLTTGLPYEASRDLGGEGQIYVEASPVGDGVNRLTVQIRLDGEPVYTEFGPLVRGSIFKFAYAFGEIFTTEELGS